MGERSGAPRASALHHSSCPNLRLRFNYRSQMSQLTVTHPSLVKKRFASRATIANGLPRNKHATTAILRWTE